MGRRPHLKRLGDDVARQWRGRFADGFVHRFGGQGRHRDLHGSTRRGAVVPVPGVSVTVPEMCEIVAMTNEIRTHDN